MAVIVEDFSKLPVGTKIDRGTVQMCPHCKKFGLLEETGGIQWYTHSQWRGYDEDFNPVIGWDSCPKEKKAAPKASPAKDEF
jgi:hypothetical protein